MAHSTRTRRAHKPDRAVAYRGRRHSCQGRYQRETWQFTVSQKTFSAPCHRLRACRALLPRFHSRRRPHTAQDKRLIAALDLVRRMPPARIEQTLEGVLGALLPRALRLSDFLAHAHAQSWSIWCPT